MEVSAVPDWLFEESYQAVGDLAETIALLLPRQSQEPALQADLSLAEWVSQRLLVLGEQTEDEQRANVLDAWRRLDDTERYIYNKLITGSFRVGVSEQLVIRALARASEIDEGVIAHRLSGHWTASAENFSALIAPDSSDADRSRPFPFYLAYALEGDLESLGDTADWQAEWKWDGIRSQVIRRDGQTYIWSRGGELMTDRFPELVAATTNLPDGTVLDGEIMPWKDGAAMPFAQLQRRIGRKKLGPKILADVPIVLIAYDILELSGRDMRSWSLALRRAELEKVISAAARNPVQVVNDTVAAPSSGRQTNLFADLLASHGEQEPVRPSDVESGAAQSGAIATASQRDAARNEESGIAFPLLISPITQLRNWKDARDAQVNARDHRAEGLMLKRLDSEYGVGRRKGSWWKWKVQPYTVDAVMVYAQPGHGRRALLHTDYTFAVRDGEALVPFAKAYSGLTDVEIRSLDNWIRRHTVEKFGPVRHVEPTQVFELHFEGIQSSPRHKSGVAVRFPRIARWRTDKPVAEIDTMDSLRALLEAAQ